jgi:hypothetical protein
MKREMASMLVVASILATGSYARAEQEAAEESYFEGPGGGEVANDGGRDRWQLRLQHDRAIGDAAGGPRVADGGFCSDRSPPPQASSRRLRVRL